MEWYELLAKTEYWSYPRYHMKLLFFFFFLEKQCFLFQTITKSLNKSTMYATGVAGLTSSISRDPDGSKQI